MIAGLAQSIRSTATARPAITIRQRQPFPLPGRRGTLAEPLTATGNALVRGMVVICVGFQPDDAGVGNSRNTFPKYIPATVTLLVVGAASRGGPFFNLLINRPLACHIL